MSQARDELHTDIVALGLFAENDPVGRRMARHCVAVTIGAVEVLLDGEEDDVHAIAGDLARIAAGALALGGS
jgi:hypothetical protein